MPSEKVSQLDPATAIVGGDYLYIVKSVDGTPTSFKAPVSALSSLLNSSSLGNVLWFGADPTGVEDSTAAFQAAIDSDYAVYVPYGDYRIDGELVIDQYGKIIVTERGAIPIFRYWAAPDQAPFSGAVGSRCRFFKDNDSENTNFFKIRSGYAAIMGFPVFDVTERDSEVYNKAAILYAPNEDNAIAGELVVNPQPRMWGGWLEIIVINDPDIASNAGEGINCVEADWGDPETDGGYMVMQEWEIYGQNVRYGVYLGEREDDAGQFANTLRAKLYLDGFKQAVYNHSFSSAHFYGTAQARHLLDATEHPKAVCDVSWSSVIDIHSWDLSSDPDGSGHYKPSYFLENSSSITRVKHNSFDDVNALNGFLPNGRADGLYAPWGYVPPRVNNFGDIRPGLTISALYNNWANLYERSSTFAADLYAGDEVGATTAVSDCVFANASGTDVDITSALGSIPTLAVGALFEITDHSESDNNGTYKVLSSVTNGYNCEKQPRLYNVTDNPSNASSEAVNVVTGLGALTDDSVTAGITSNAAQLSVTGSLQNVAKFYNCDVRWTVDADAVSDADYLEFHWTHDNENIDWAYFSFTSNGGFSQAQIVRLASGAVVDNQVISTPTQNDEDKQNLIRFALSGDTADETIVRFGGFLDTTKVYRIHDFAGYDNTSNSNANLPVVTTQGGQTVLGPMTFASNIDATNLPTSNPSVAGRLWNDNGTLMVSSG